VPTPKGQHTSPTEKRPDQPQHQDKRPKPQGLHHGGARHVHVNTSALICAPDPMTKARRSGSIARITLRVKAQNHRRHRFVTHIATANIVASVTIAKGHRIW